jgi:DNA-binding transcriptional regulator YdaS (Cro superfamily)
MEFRANTDRMRKLVRILGTQEAVAKALNISKQTFNYWFNYANKISSKQILAMEKLLDSVVTKFWPKVQYI